MRNKFAIAAAAALIAYSAWWYMAASTLRDDVFAVVEEVQHHIRVGNSNARLHVDGVHVSGFPFAQRASIEAARFSVIYGDETFAVELPHMVVTRGSKDGEYRWQVPGNQGSALYAKVGTAPEAYTFSWDHALTLRSFGDSTTRLRDVAFMLPEAVTIKATLGTKTQAIGFTFDTIRRVALSRSQPLPQDVSSAIMLMVGTLREALVYR